LIRILLDQGLPRSTAYHLQDDKWEILHVGDIGLSKAKDTELIEYAREDRRVIITLDSDFHAFLAVTNANSPSVVRIRIEGLKGPDVAMLIRQIWPKIKIFVWQGAMVTVTEKSIRIHELPVS
jgi:predicted nuclease of predicted toxin-antitoxin system